MSGHHIVSPKTYLAVFIALMALLVLTVVAVEIEHEVLNNVVAMTIAIVKAVLIIAIFMHVKYGSHLTKLYACAGFLWFLIFVFFIMSDYKTRDWTPTRHNFSVSAEEK